MFTLLLVASEDTEGHELAFAIDFGDRDNDSVDDARVENCILDLAQLDSETIELDLIVFTPEASNGSCISGCRCKSSRQRGRKGRGNKKISCDILQRAILRPPGKITGPVERLPVGVPHEGRVIWAVKVALGKLGSSHTELADRSVWYRLETVTLCRHDDGRYQAQWMADIIEVGAGQDLRHRHEDSSFRGSVSAKS